MRETIEAWTLPAGYVSASGKTMPWTKTVYPNEHDEPERDRQRHLRMDKELAKDYFDALSELAKEGNERAQVVVDMLTRGDIERNRGDSQADRPPAVFDWAYNIHHNTWGETSFAGVLKARVVFNRVKRGIDAQNT
jgi:hypothetical protein